MSRGSSTPAGSTDALTSALRALAHGERPGEHLVAEALGHLMSGDASQTQAAGLLMGLRVAGETGAELAGAVRALRNVMRRVPLPKDAVVVDTCGTGGGVVGTFNVSTAAALVVLGAGVSVAKHGNRSYTSRCGSADVLEALGIEIATEPDRAAASLEQVGFAFLFAPAFHPAMRHVAPVRRDLGVPTIMNLVGPLANPAGVRRQVIGVADRDRAAIVADALGRLGTDHALVVHADVGMDEIAPQGVTFVWEVRGRDVTTWEITPDDMSLSSEDLSALAGGLPAENAQRIERLLADPAADRAGRAVVALNAGAALYVAGAERTFSDGVRRALDVLDGGEATGALNRLRAARPSTSG